MTRFLISGLINVETTLRISGFPLAYNPVNYPFWGVQSRVSGVGYNLCRALLTLGSQVDFLSLIGSDAAAGLVQTALTTDGIPAEHVLAQAAQTAQSVILYDEQGRRQIHVDLKNIQELIYPPEIVETALSQADWALLCNINFSRPMLARAARAGKPIALDLHTLADLHDPYNRDFLLAAQVLFMSDERLPLPPEDWVRAVWAECSAEVVVIGLGAQGALLGLRGPRTLTRIPAVFTRPVVNTIGAGDALFSAFMHSYAQSGDARAALERAVTFASYKIGVASAADGFLSAAELEDWHSRVFPCG